MRDASRRSCILARHVCNGGGIEAKLAHSDLQSTCTVAVWANLGGEQRIGQVLRPLCDQVGVQLHVFSPACGVLFPQHNPDVAAREAARLTDSQRAEAEAELKQVCSTAEVWLGWPESSWEKVSDLIGGWPPQLRWIQTLSAGTDELMAVVPTRVSVTRAEGKFDHSIAEWVLTWIFMHAKKMRIFLERQQQRTWQRQFQGISRVAGASVLIVGYGSIGQRVACLCRAVGMQVVATKKSAAEMIPGDVTLHPAGDLRALLPKADYVVLSMPLTSETRASFGQPELSAMKAGAALINIARGEIVDWTAVCNALRQGKLEAYFTDVTTPEPLPDGHPDWSLPNLFVTPHNSWAPHPDMADDARRFFKNLQRFLAEDQLVGIVDRSRGY